VFFLHLAGLSREVEVILPGAGPGGKNIRVSGAGDIVRVESGLRGTQIPSYRESRALVANSLCLSLGEGLRCTSEASESEVVI